jgi:hypothetical protein
LSAISFSVFSQSPAPSDKFNLENWKLTLPVSEAYFYGRGTGHAAQVLPANNWYQKPVLLDAGFSDPRFFYMSEDGAMTFRVPLDDEAVSTTVNSRYARSELRELYHWDRRTPDHQANWSLREGEHILKAKVRIAAFYEADPQVVVGQIHSRETHKPMVKLLWDGPNKPLRGIINHDPLKGFPFSLYFDPVGLEAFSYEIEVSSQQLSIRINDKEPQVVVFGKDGMSESWRDYHYYFKAGSYAQANVGSPGEFEVRFYELEALHR